MAWKKRQINQRFLTTLFEDFGFREFTTKQAEDVYVRDHWEGSPKSKMFLAASPEEYIRKHPELDEQQRKNVMLNFTLRTPNQFTRMSARNSISAAVAFGELRRVERGVYMFKRGGRK